MFTISIVNRKGGCGKTTTAINLAGLFAKHYNNKQVLIIDLDTQNHVRYVLGEKKRKTQLGIHSIFSHHFPSLDSLQQNTHLPNLHFIPASEDALENNNGHYHQLKWFLQQAQIQKKFDLLIIDTPPNHGAFMNNALQASDGILLSFVPQLLDQIGVQQILKIIQRHAREKTHLAFLPCMMKKRIKHHHQILSNIVKDHGNACLLKGIRSNIQLSEAMQAGKAIDDYAKRSIGAYDYHMLLNELVLIWPEMVDATKHRKIHENSSKLHKNIVNFNKNS